MQEILAKLVDLATAHPAAFIAVLGAALVVISAWAIRVSAFRYR